MALTTDAPASLSVDPDDRTSLRIEGVRLRPPFAHQGAGAARRAVAARWALVGGEARLELGAYDRKRALVIGWHAAAW